MGLLLLWIAVSYDIVCQWKIHLAQRITTLPSHITDHLNNPSPIASRLRFGLPVWHAAVHEKNCQVANSLRYQPGMAHTDGEGIERGWSRINPMASSTKEMGQGARHDTLDDHFGYHNWQRNLGLGTCIHLLSLTRGLTYVTAKRLSRKLLVATEERNKQVAAFIEVRDTIPKEAAKEYVKMVEAWEKDNTQPNPYEEPSNGTLLLSPLGSLLNVRTE